MRIAHYFLAVPIIFCTVGVNAEVPQSISIQGYLENQFGAPFNGQVWFTVAIFDVPLGGPDPGPADDCDQAGTAVWISTAPLLVTVDDGVFTLIFGDSNLIPQLFGVAGNGPTAGPRPRWIELGTSTTGSSPFETMCPRIEVRTAPFAFRAGFVDNPELTDHVELGSSTPSQAGSASVFNAMGIESITLDGIGPSAGGGSVTLRNSDGVRTVEMFSRDGGSLVPPQQSFGRLDLLTGTGLLGASLYAEPGVGNGAGGALHLWNATGPGSPNTLVAQGYDCCPPNGTPDPGSRLMMFNGLTATSPADATITFDANNNGSGGARIGIRNGLPTNLETITLLGNGAGNGGATLSLTNGVDANATVHLTSSAGVLGSGAMSLRKQGDIPGMLLAAASEEGAELQMTNNSGLYTVDIQGGGGGSGAGARISLKNGHSPDNQETLALNANGIGPGGSRLTMRTGSGQSTVFLDANDLAGGGAELALRRSDGSYGIVLDTESGTPNTRPAQLYMAAPGNLYTVFLSSGDDVNRGAALHLYNGGVPSQSPNQETIYVNGNDPTTNGGVIEIRNNGSTPLIQLLADDPDVPDNNDARVCVLGKINTRYLTLNGSGRCDQPAAVSIEGAAGTASFDGCVTVGALHSNGGCDVAESFSLTDQEKITPGMVVVIDEMHQGSLRLSSVSYDKKVVGVVSGAGGLKPGITLGPIANGGEDLPTALSGRVYCYVDSTENAIEIGDLLTTSTVPGHAMKVTDFARSQGAVE